MTNNKKIRKSFDEKKIKNDYKILCQNRLQEYYAGTYFGYPACYAAIMISIQMNKETNDSLWLFIISVTYHFLFSHITNEQYDKLYFEFKKYVISLSQNYYKDENKKRKRKNIDNGICKPWLTSKSIQRFLKEFLFPKKKTIIFAFISSPSKTEDQMTANRAAL